MAGPLGLGEPTNPTTTLSEFENTMEGDERRRAFASISTAGREVPVDGKTLLIHESHDTCDPDTGRTITGSWLWDSSLYLSDFMVTDPRIDVAGKRVLELGAGTGLPGLTAAVLGARSVVLTDLSPLLPTLYKNAEVNGLGDRIEVRELRWGSENEENEEFLVGVDVVLMSDVFYDASEMRGLAWTLRRVCREATKVWAATEVRVGVEDCLKVLEEEGFGVEEISVGRRSPREGVEDEESSIFKTFLLKSPGRVGGQRDLKLVRDEDLSLPIDVVSDIHD